MAIESAFSGIVFYSREVLKALSGTASNSVNNDSHIEELTERELDVLRLLCEGMSPKEIGEKLFLSPRTVEKHKDNIMQKMEVSSVAKLISVALKNKLI
jgi:DNA-binding NarL/FixJ family response regulator